MPRIFNNITVLCMRKYFCHNISLWLFVCLCVCYHWAKIDQAGGPEAFFNFVWPYRVLKN